MSQPRPSRQFPPVPGFFGWAGVLLVGAAFVSDMVAALLMVLAVANRNGRLVLPLVIAFFLTFPLLGGALALWLIGSKRAGVLRRSTTPRERQRQLFGPLARVNLARPL